MEQNRTQLKQQKKRRRQLMILGVVAVVFTIAAIAVSSWIRMPDLPGGPALLPEQGGEVTGVPSGANRKPGVYTFLVAGRDVASGSTDTMLLLTFDTKAKTIHGLNLPRDTMMNVSTSSKRLNAVYSYNRGKDKDTQVEKGMTALKAAVADLTGVLPDFYILVEWEAIGELVDAVGGVEFEVPFDMDYDDPYQDPPLHIHQKAGLRTLDGGDAMEVIRWRKNNDGSGGSGGDIARLSIQQDFLKAVVKKCLQPSIVLKLNSLVEIFKENVETDLTVGNILALAQQAVGMDPDTGVEFFTAPLADAFRYNKAALVTLDAQGMLDIVNSRLNPYTEDITLEELEILVRGTDGSFSVTSGTLADGIRGKVSRPEPTPETEPEVEGESTEPETPTEGEGVLPEDPELSGDPETDEPEEPEAPVEGEPTQPEEQPIPEEPEPQPEQEQIQPQDPPVEDPVSPNEGEHDAPVSEENQPNPVAVLPPRPVPVEQAA